MTRVARSTRLARSARLLACVFIAGLMLAACGPLSELIDSRESRMAPTRVLCGSSTYDAAAWRDAPPAESLPPGPASAVDDAGAPAFDPSEPWRVVYQSAERVDLVRELDAPIDQGDGDVRTHEARTLERIVGATNIADGTWLLTAAGPCAQRVVRDDGLGPADVTLAEPVDPSDTTIALAVVEHACASGQPADDRVVVEVVESDTEVAVTVGVRPAGGAQNCPSNPVTPVEVELDAPVGDREIVDAAVIPARPLVPVGQ